MSLSTALSWIGAHIVLILFAIVIVSSIATALTPARYRHARWYGWLVRFNDRVSVLTHPDALGTLKWPMLASAFSPQLAAVLEALAAANAAPRGSAGFVSIKAMQRAAAACISALLLGSFILAISAFAHGCAGSQTNIGVTGGGTVSPGGDVSWQVGVNIGVGIARAAIPVAKSTIDADPRLTAAQHAQADIGLQIATDALPELVDAASALALAPTVPNQCRVHFAAEHVITGALQGVTIAKDAGAVIPPALSMALAGLSTIADMVYPNCIASGAPTMARRISAQERVQAALR